MRKGWASRTAMWVAALRGLADLDDPAITADPFAVELLPFGYASLVRAAERTPRFTRAVLRGAARATRNLSRHMALRTRAIDDVVVAEARSGSRQLVLLGAGFDARAWRLGLAGVTVFEVDHPDTQASKRAAIGAHVPLARDVKWAAIDFARGGSIADVLARAGHEPSERTTFVWEGVTMYLTREAIDATLSDVAAVAAPGSCVVATYYDAAFRLEAVPLAWLVRAAGEPFRTRMLPSEVRARFEAHGFVVERDEGSDDWSERYLREPAYRDAERIVTARKGRSRG